MSAVLQAHGLLRLCHTVVRSVQFPNGLPLPVDLLDLAFAPRDEQVARLGHLLHAPRQETALPSRARPPVAAPAVNLLAVACKLVDAAQGHVCHQERATARQSGITELPVYRTLLIDGQLELFFDAAFGYLHDHHLGRSPVLHEHYVSTADGLYGVDLRALWGCIAPYGLLILRHLSDAILVGHEYVSVAGHHRVADFTAFELVVVTPGYPSVFHDEHPPLLALSGIEEVVAREQAVLQNSSYKRQCRTDKGG